jgi:hypothetical protein
MQTDYDSPIMSWQGKADNVRKVVSRFCEGNLIPLSAEHAAYIGSEIAKAELLKTEYVQD